MLPAKGPTQQLVIYDLDGVTGKEFASVYTDEQATKAIAPCRHLHGQHCNARTILASRRAQGIKRP